MRARVESESGLGTWIRLGSSLRQSGFSLGVWPITYMAGAFIVQVNAKVC